MEMVMTIGTGDVYKFDLAVEKISDVEIIIAAAETEDELGCVLRFHLMLESLLSFYLDEKCQGEVGKYAKPPRDFGQKLGMAAAFGIPMQIAAVIHQVNNMRNKLAHGHSPGLDKGDVKQLARLVNLMSAIDPEFTPLEKRYIELPVKRPGERITFGKEGPRTDFLMACTAFWGTALNALTQETALNKLRLLIEAEKGSAKQP
ncbi:AhpC/TSA family protein [Pseudomonas sp. WS 5146]|uniref:AhpC/TSA family protein n=1 Tax=Pseudomonas sp. WS 5146 TaxID=2717494 RepID=UPI00036F3A18|nr:AhpC/TSA family protein [Pseudomonas sp. WS 5146]